MRIVVSANNVIGPVPALRGVYMGDTPQPFIEEDVARCKEELGATCIRYGMQPSDLVYGEGDTFKEEGLARVEQFLDWCSHYGLHCILDLHNAPGRLYGGDARLWQQPVYQNRFISLWEHLAHRFADHPAVTAWELLNEAEPPNNDYDIWNELYDRTVQAIRRIDPYRAIVVDSIGYAKPQTFAHLKYNSQPNIIYSFHNYQPGPYHCQKRRELTDQSTYYYPGYIPHRRLTGNPQDFDLAHFTPSEAKHWNRAELMAEWQAVYDFHTLHKVPIFCGEFGCVSDCPAMTDMSYLMDEISIFHERGFHWTLYNYMYRTNEPYWENHFDCNLYIYFRPKDKLYRFGRKIALIEFFCRTEGEVLQLAPWPDQWVSAYGVRTPDGSLHLLIANKERHTAKRVELAVGPLPPRWSATLFTMSVGDEGFVYQGHRSLTEGNLTLDLGPLTLVKAQIPAPPQTLWTLARQEVKLCDH